MDNVDRRSSFGRALNVRIVWQLLSRRPHHTQSDGEQTSDSTEVRDRKHLMFGMMLFLCLAFRAVLLTVFLTVSIFVMFRQFGN